MVGIARRAVYLAMVLSAVLIAALESWLLGATVAWVAVWAEVSRCSFWR